jgi:hypothetical protein
MLQINGTCGRIAVTMRDSGLRIEQDGDDKVRTMWTVENSAGHTVGVAVRTVVGQPRLADPMVDDELSVAIGPIPAAPESPVGYGGMFGVGVGVRPDLAAAPPDGGRVTPEPVHLDPAQLKASRGGHRTLVWQAPSMGDWGFESDLDAWEHGA